VLADPQPCHRVARLLDDVRLPHTDASTWRHAVAAVTTRPALAIVDLDDVGANAAGLVALMRSGWGEPVPFILLGHRRAIAEVAAGLGAAAGWRKPIAVGRLITMVTRLPGLTRLASVKGENCPRRSARAAKSE
jgi:hypothetical protein